MSRSNSIGISAPVFVCVFLALCLWLAPSVIAANRVHIDVTKSGHVLTPYDTLFVGGEYQLRYWIENDFIIGGMSTNIRIWSDDGATWEYVSQPTGLGSSGYFTSVPGSRISDSAFEMTGVLVLEYDIDLYGDDILGWGGVALRNGLQPGPSEHMVSLHFRPLGPYAPGDAHTLCFDTCSISPPSPWIWVDLYGSAMTPQWGGRLCMPVKLLCGNPNGDNDVNVGDAVFMINYVFRDGLAPDPWWLGDANCDGTLDVGDVVFLIAASFRYGPQPECCE